MSMSSVALLMDMELSVASPEELPISRHIKPQGAPVWASSLVALEEGDTEQLDQLFRQDKNRIPVKNRSDAAQALGSTANAQSIVFESLTHNPDDEELQARQLNYGLATSAFVETALQHQQIATWRDTQATMLMEVQYAHGVRVGMLLSGTSQSNSDRTFFTPQQEKVSGLNVKIENFLGSSELQWQQRQELVKTNAWVLNHAWKADERLNLQAHALYHAETNDSLALRSMGMQNGLSASIDYRLGSREYLSLQPGVSNYFYPTRVCLLGAAINSHGKSAITSEMTTPTGVSVCTAHGKISVPCLRASEYCQVTVSCIHCAVIWDSQFKRNTVMLGCRI